MKDHVFLLKRSLFLSRSFPPVSQPLLFAAIRKQSGFPRKWSNNPKPNWKRKGRTLVKQVSLKIILENHCCHYANLHLSFAMTLKGLADCALSQKRGAIGKVLKYAMLAVFKANMFPVVHLGLGGPRQDWNRGPLMTSSYSANRDNNFWSSLGQAYAGHDVMHFYAALGLW